VPRPAMTAYSRRLAGRRSTALIHR
jgi:hypothetical protein